LELVSATPGVSLAVDVIGCSTAVPGSAGAISLPLTAVTVPVAVVSTADTGGGGGLRDKVIKHYYFHSEINQIFRHGFGPSACQAFPS